MCVRFVGRTGDASGLGQHKSWVHIKGEKRYKCKVCSKAFYKTSTLNAHMATHSDVRPHGCTICDKSFKSSFEKQRHELQVHSAERPYKCEFCNAAFKRQDHLRGHCNTVH